MITYLKRNKYIGKDMAEFFNSLSVLEIIFFVLGGAATIILVIQIILMLIGIGGDADGNFEVSESADTDAGGDVALFTVKGIIAFFSVGSWIGFGMSRAGIHIAIVIVTAFLSGAAALFGVGFLLRAMMKLQSNGNINLKNAVGLTARVYLTIPPKNKGLGKINLTLQERYIEAEAVTESDTAIPTGEAVRITGVINEVFIVEKIEK